MAKGLWHRCTNRLLHALARHLPGSVGLRPALHRLRGVKIGHGVFIGDEVYIENEYPESVEIGDGVQISVRAIIVAHTRGPGQVVLGRNVFIGPNVVVACAGGKRIVIGDGAVISAGCVITRDVGAGILVANEQPKAIARATVSMADAQTIDSFIRGLVPIRRRNPRPSNSAGSQSGN